MENKIILTVTELTSKIKELLEYQFTSIWVEGEISNLRIPSSGHFYFTLKDTHSQIRSIMFRYQQRLLKFIPEDGMNVICYGRINVYQPRGEYQIIVETIEPKGRGALQVAFEQMKQKLHAEGLFDAENKKPLPILPSKIAIVTSPTGAAVRDILNIINRRFPNLEILIAPVKVQGDEAPDEIVEAIELLNTIEKPDVIILARGGGSLEDLWAFNEEKVARAIFTSQIPIISAIGHETDFTITDFVSDLRAPTPSAAAELVIREKDEFFRQLSHSIFRLKNATLKKLEQGKNCIRHLTLRLQSPQKRLEDYLLRHDDFCVRMVNRVPSLLREKKTGLNHAKRLIAMRSPLHTVATNKTKLFYIKRALISLVLLHQDKRKAWLQSCSEKLHALSPLHILNRGYSITRLVPSHKIIKRATELQRGNKVDIQFSEGNALCLVDKVIP